MKSIQALSLKISKMVIRYVRDEVAEAKKEKEKRSKKSCKMTLGD